MKKVYKTILLVLILLSLSFVLISCGSDETEKENDKVRIVVRVAQDPDFLDPHRAAASGTYEIMFNVFEGLLDPNTDGGVKPAVASSYSVSDDGKVYTFKLRKGIKFHNNNLVTVEDIKYSLDRLIGTENSNGLSTEFSNKVEKVSIVDDDTVKVFLKELDTNFLSNFIQPIIPKDNDEFQNTKPIGTGPFKFVEYIPGQKIIMEKNENYWNKDVPKIDEIEFRIIPDEQASLLSFKAGEIDMYPRISAEYIESLGENSYVVDGAQNLVQLFAFNMNRKPFNDKRVREAINHVVDKDQIIKALANDYGSKIGTNMSPAMKKYYNEDLENYYDVNIDKAKELLNDAGYKDGFDMIITVPSNYKFHVDTAQIIVEQLKQVGINASIEQVEWGVWLDRVYTSRDYQSTVIAFTGKLNAYDVLKKYMSDYPRNFINYNNEEFDKTMNDIGKEINEDKRVELYKKAEAILTSDAPAVFIMDPNLIVAIKDHFQGYQLYPLYIQDISTMYKVE
ncbi:peptide/nickel transport system substrate-binding protein [Oceanotoga teriensis]|uniref:Peptide/nickel transport system substrate-binding protein n=1 Tax=Oceanotoga teriensis TaxID=515440 RepID=A0AA45C5N1_9BACT|nr:ABC transporter substrate-binding protein [Oceanotoga teriensis]PWJ89335.1 peptide/nickel transport system substrate-binding protein [Oceanotoga teriensis]